MNIVVIRFSSLGDVALTSPVIASILNNNPSVRIWYVSNLNFSPLFPENERLHFIPADLKGKHKGILGLKKLVNEIIKEVEIDTVVDLHDVLRTKIIRLFLKIKGINTITFNKGRKEKKQLINGKIPFKPLPHTTERYANAFKKIVNNISINKGPIISKSLNVPVFFDTNSPTIGIAPYAAHKSKEWGEDKIDQLIQRLSNYNILLFGGKLDQEKLWLYEKKYSYCKSIAGKFNLGDELKIISNLKLMICMDSANMHLANLTFTPVISIWGPTHHYLGYGPLNDIPRIVEVPRGIMPCRPCTIYGKVKNKNQKNCAKKSMEKISVQQVLDKVHHELNN